MHGEVRVKTAESIRFLPLFRGIEIIHLNLCNLYFGEIYLQVSFLNIISCKITTSWNLIVFGDTVSSKFLFKKSKSRNNEFARKFCEKFAWKPGLKNNENLKLDTFTLRKLEGG